MDYKEEESCSNPEQNSSEFEGEKWAQIPGYSKYSASTLGRIKLQNGRITEGRIAKSGYRYITLCNNSGEFKSRPVHRLVALTWIPNPENKPFVDHIDRCPWNAKASNLRWCTAAENRQNRGPRFDHKLTNQYSSDNFLIKEWCGVSSITKELGYNHREIFKACKENTLLDNCYWKFVDDIPIEGEVWKKLVINGCTVEVSSFGRVLQPSGCTTYGWQNRAGYMGIAINRKNYLVHRLVLLAHCPIDNPKLYEVNHKNFVINYKGNFLANLEWCTRSENINHSVINRNKSKTMRPVCQYNFKGKFICKFDTMRDAYRSLGEKNSTGILASCETKKRHMRYFWRYASDSLGEIENTRNKGCIPVNKFSLKGKFIQRYNSITDALEDLGENLHSRHGCIIDVCKGRKISAYKFIWRYADKENKNVIPDDVEGKNPPKYNLPVRQYNLYGKFIKEFATMREAYSLFNDEGSTGIHAACSDKFKRYRESYWRYASENLDSVDPPARKNAVAVDMLDLNGEFLRSFKSVALAADVMGNKNFRPNISAVCRGVQKTAYGHIWRYSKDEDEEGKDEEGSLEEEEENLEEEKDLDDENLKDAEEIDEADLDEIDEEDLEELDDDEEIILFHETAKEEKNKKIETPTQEKDSSKSTGPKTKSSSHKEALKRTTTKIKKITVDGIVIGMLKPKSTGK